jgi:hypothetical protein
MVELLRHLFVDPTPVANRNNSEDSAVPIDRIDDAKSPHPVFP